MELSSKAHIKVKWSEIGSETWPRVWGILGRTQYFFRRVDKWGVKRKWQALCFGVLVCGFSGPLWAGEYSQVLTAGIAFATGPTSKSLNGSNSYFLSFGAEKRKGAFRPKAGFDLGFGSGTAYLGSDTPTFTLFNGQFDLGFSFFPFTVERFQPFVGGSGVLGWGILVLGSAPTGVEPSTQSILYGYQLDVGVDLYLGKADGNAVRLLSSFLYTLGSLGGQSGFVFSGFRFAIGLVL